MNDIKKEFASFVTGENIHHGKIKIEMKLIFELKCKSRVVRFYSILLQSDKFCYVGKNCFVTRFPMLLRTTSFCDQ